jgi:hypothetical protein
MLSIIRFKHQFNSKDVILDLVFLTIHKYKLYIILRYFYLVHFILHKLVYRQYLNGYSNTD